MACMCMNRVHNFFDLCHKIPLQEAKIKWSFSCFTLLKCIKYEANPLRIQTHTSFIITLHLFLTSVPKRLNFKTCHQMLILFVKSPGLKEEIWMSSLTPDWIYWKATEIHFSPLHWTLFPCTTPIYQLTSQYLSKWKYEADTTHQFHEAFTRI